MNRHNVCSWPDPEATSAGRQVRSLGASCRGHNAPETARLTLLGHRLCIAAFEIMMLCEKTEQQSWFRTGPRGSVRLGAGELHHLPPLRCFLDNELFEFGRGAGKCCLAQFDKTRSELRFG